jgi:hypothetical protein
MTVLCVVTNPTAWTWRRWMRCGVEEATADVPEQPDGSIPALDEAPAPAAAESADTVDPATEESETAGEQPAAAVSGCAGDAASESMSQLTRDVEDFQAQVLSRLDRIEALLDELRTGAR